MKQAQVKVGEKYLTKVAGCIRLVPVVVLSSHEPDGCFNKRTTYTVRRMDNDKVLPKRRTAAALAPCNM